MNERERIPVILDVDTGVDDAVMLMLAASSDRLDIRALTCVFGNRDVDTTSLNTLKLCELLGIEAPVAKGLAKPLLDPAIDYSGEPVLDIHGKDGLGGIGSRLPFPRKALSPLTAAELTAKTVSECKGKVTLIATGPLTNIAAFLLGYPHLQDRIEQILFMGGAASGGNIKPSVEANIGHDPDAAAVVLTSGLPVTMFGLDATMSCFITDEERGAMKESGNTGAFLCDCLAAYSRTYQTLAGLPGAVLHDSLPVAWLLDPSVAELRKYYVEVDLGGRETRGCTVTDTADVLKKTPNVSVAVKADRKRFMELHLDAVRRFR